MGDVSVLGCGHVGLTTAVCLAQLGHNVIASDADHKRIKALNRGRVPTFDPQMKELLNGGLDAGRLRFVTNPAAAVERSRFHFICLPTGPLGPGGKADLTAVEATISEMSEVFPSGSVVIIRSAVPIGTADQIRAQMMRPDLAVATVPEFFGEGTAIDGFLSPDRIVIGATNDRATKDVAALFDDISPAVVTMSNRSAEAVKYGADAFLVTQRSFVDSLARICGDLDADLSDVLAGLESDDRITAQFLDVGLHGDEHCPLKDVAAFCESAHSDHASATSQPSPEEADEAQIDTVTMQIMQALGPRAVEPRSGCDRRVGFWGLTSASSRSEHGSSSALDIVRQLLVNGVNVQAFDPTGDVPHDELPGLTLTGNAYQAAAGCDALIVWTEWEEFPQVDLATAAEVMRTPRMLDARNVFVAQGSVLSEFVQSGLGR